MKRVFKLQNVQWVKITEPTEADIREINLDFKLHPLISRELLVPTIRPKIDAYQDHLYAVIHVPVFDPKDRKTYPQEIDLVLTKNTVITVSYQTVTPLEEFWNLAQKDAENPHLEHEAGHFLYHLIHHLFLFSLRQLDHIQENINTLEDIIFYGKNDEIARDIYIARRDLIDFRRTLKPQAEVFRSLEERAPQLYGKHLEPFFRNLTGEYLRLWDLLEGHKETVQELYETHESIVAGNINKTVKVFTVLAFITFIPSLITNIFGMTINNLPLADHPNAFWIIVGFSIILSLSAYYYFKVKNII